MKQFGDFVKTIYDGIRDTKEKLKSAEESKDEGEVERVKGTLASSQEVLFRVVTAAFEKGDEQVLENLGGNNPLVANLVAALRDCVNASDFNGKLPKALLSLMSTFITVTDDTLHQRLKFEKIQKRFLAKGDAEVIGLVRKILANTVESRERQYGTKVNTPESSSTSASHVPSTVAATSIRNASAASTTRATVFNTETDQRKTPIPIPDLGKNGKGVTRVTSDVANSKRPRDDDSDTRGAKKFAANSAAGTPQPTTKVPISAKSATSGSAQPTTAHKAWSGSALLPGKSRTIAKAATKADTPKGDATKLEMAKASLAAKPETAKLVPAKRDATKTEMTKADLPKTKKAAVPRSDVPPSGTSKLGALLEEIAKPKKAPQSVATPDSSSEASETPKEKEIRLRKESRRKLRVSWREGDSLAEIRVFHKDVGEDESRVRNVFRDARDDRSEGMALKQSKQTAQLDDDEDDDIPYQPWVDPTPFDFSSIPAEKKAESYTTRGGDLPVQTSEQKIMKDRENNVLMVVYTDPSDIPPTPRSPVPSHGEPSDSVGHVVTLPANDPKFDELQQRWKDVRSGGSTWAALQAWRRIGKQQLAGSVGAANVLNNVHSLASTAAQHPAGYAAPYSHSYQPLPASAPSTSSSDEVLRLLNSASIKAWKDPDPFDPAHPKTQRRHDYPDPNLQASADAVEEIAAKLSGKPFPPTEPPDYITDPARKQEWWQGFNRDKERQTQRAEQNRAQAEAQTGGPFYQNSAPSQSASQTGQLDPMTAINAYMQFGQAQPQNQDAAAALQQSQVAQYYASYYQQQQQQQQQVTQPHGAQQAAAAPPGDPNAQLTALLAQFGGQARPAQQQNTAALVQPYPQNDQVQALLAAVGAANQSSPLYQAQPVADATGAADAMQQAYLLTQWAAAHQQAQQLQGQQQEEEAHGSASRTGGASSSHARGGKREAAARDAQDPTIPTHLRGINRALIGTKPCVFWASGKCAKGDKCTFRHD